MRALLLTLLVILLVQNSESSQAVSEESDVNTNVVIGIYLMPSSFEQYPEKNYSYIAASYVKYLEMSGAQVIPIYFDADEEYYNSIITKINGLLFTGGTYDFGNNTWTLNAAYLYKKIIEANNNGIHIPLWGTCLGFELLLAIQAGTNQVQSTIDNERSVSHPINIVRDGILFSEMPQNLYQISQKQDIWFFNHFFCITMKTFYSYQSLMDFYYVLATAQNDKKEVFIAVIESKKYPIWGVQFHPEKNNFEWRVPANHTLKGIVGSQYFGNFFVNEARKNFNKFVSQEELNSQLIYNWNPLVFPPNETSFTQVYIIPNYQQAK